MLFCIQIANKIIEIKSIYETIYTFCRRYIINKDSSVFPDIVIDITEEDIAKEYAASRHTFSESEEPASPDYLETIAAYRKIVEALIPFGRMLMHGSVVSTAGYGYMFTAPSGVGKTTRTRLWIENIPDSIVVNGDKPLLEVTEKSIIAYGTPWSGKESWNHNIEVPLHAIMLLERTTFPNEFVLEELKLKDVYAFLMQQIYLPSHPILLRKVLRMLKGMQDRVNFYRFRSEPTPVAIERAFETVRQKYY